MSDDVIDLNFPRHLHQASGAWLQVADAAEQAAALKAGWFLTPNAARLDAERKATATTPHASAHR